ncbi:hypothetical protein [Pseudonocardia sp. D17]|uniref:hypothetical protein n=1 Tax=Pseudonocardia sp. D17 TaxID=882661 RepID=UPI002B3D157D|nr:hypothetical protein PSD17_55280 [Pseudonocardia sp. D17]
MDDLEKTIALMGTSESVTIGQPTLGLVYAALVENDSLRARLAAQQPVIDAAETWERQRYGRGPWPEGTERWPQVEKRLREAVRALRAALSGSVEARREEIR